jgi:tRNA(fMet)-specific endonuclease VapC
VLVLDTNHLTELGYETGRGPQLARLLEDSGRAVVTTIVSVEEQLRGWLSRLAKLNDVHKQMEAYEELGERVVFLARFTFLPWDGEAGDLFKHLRKQRIRIGSMDLKIACITIAHEAILLTRNTVDFAQVPGLRFENWLD